MKKTFILSLFSLVAVLMSCGGDSKTGVTAGGGDQVQSMVADPEKYDPKRGEGKWTAEILALTDKLDESMAKEGESTAMVKCNSCHKYTEEKLVGPGWKNVTKRRTGEWILNFITNPDPMINKDPEAQAMLELCLVRMPNQSLTDDQARKIFEFMRKNDLLK
ncbi:MAG: c-type cytochrome [Bacteroidota bacterium]